MGEVIEDGRLYGIKIVLLVSFKHGTKELGGEGFRPYVN